MSFPTSLFIVCGKCVITAYASTQSFTFLSPNYSSVMVTCLLPEQKKEYWYFGFSSFTWITEHGECCLEASLPTLLLITFREGCVFCCCHFFICLILFKSETTLGKQRQLPNRDFLSLIHLFLFQI